MIEAVSTIVAEKGYTETKLDEIIRRAGVSRTTFYEQFADKQELFLAAYAESVEIQSTLIRAAFEQHDDALLGLEAGLRTYLSVLEQAPAFARAFLIEVRLAGPDALEKRNELLDQYAEMLRIVHSTLTGRYANLPPASDAVLLAGVAALEDLVMRAVLAGRTDRLPGLERDALYLLLALLGVPDAAELADQLAAIAGAPSRRGA